VISVVETCAGAPVLVTGIAVTFDFTLFIVPRHRNGRISSQTVAVDYLHASHFHCTAVTTCQKALTRGYILAKKQSKTDLTKFA